MMMGEILLMRAVADRKNLHMFSTNTLDASSNIPIPIPNQPDLLSTT